MRYGFVMTRFLVALLALSAAAALWGGGALRLAGFAGLGLAAIGAIVALLRARNRREARKRLEGLRALPPAAFEEEVARWLRRCGWQVEHVGGTGDGGIDLLATRGKEVLAVQCKRYAEHAAVSAAQVRDLYGAAVAAGATSAALVTTGRVSSAARAWAEALPDGLEVAIHDAACVARLAQGHGRIAG